MKAFNEAYETAYELLYASDDYVDYGKAVDLCDELIRENEMFKSLYRGLCRYRQDILCSDRELAAFVMAARKHGMGIE